MLKLMVAITALTLTATAGAAGWRSLRLDARDEASFMASRTAFEKKLSPARRYVFQLALNDIWYQGARKAAADGREYTASDYFRQLDNLGYEQVITLTDPTGATARRHRADYDPFLAGNARQHGTASAAPGGPPRGMRQERAPIGFSGEQVRGIDDQSPAYRYSLRP